MTVQLVRGETLNGTVHVCRVNDYHGRELLFPICRRYSLEALHSVIETDAPVTCKRCQAKRGR